MDALPPQIFDNRRRIALRNRALDCGIEQSFLFQHMADELADRLSLVSRHFERALLLGPIAQFAARIFADRPIASQAAPAVNEEKLEFEPASFDLIVSAGTLDSVNDVPGALVQLRRCLKPDGLFLGTLFGAGSLQTLKAAMIRADSAQTAAHIHPQIDLRTAADLLARAGFTLPVADVDVLNVRYRNWQSLIADLRAAGIGNALAGKRQYVGRDFLTQLDRAWSTLADENQRVCERFNLLHLNGWAPAATQPKPAQRGSGTVSLAAILPRPDTIQ